MSLAALRKSELVTKCTQLMARVNELESKEQSTLQKLQAYDALVEEKDRLVEKTTDVLRRVAAWENNKEIMLADSRRQIEQDQKALKKTIAETCIFLHSLIQGLPENMQTLISAKISAMQTKDGLQRIVGEEFDPRVHIPLAVEGSGKKVQKYVVPGYLYQGEPLILAKVLLQ